MRAVLSIVASSILVLGCAARRPVIYLGERPTDAARAASDRDVDACLAVGVQYRSGSRADATAARDATTGGVVGAAGGAAGGAIWGSAARGAASGAAAGAAGGLVHGLFRRREPDPAYRAAVDRCLADRGRRVVAWE